MRETKIDWCDSTWNPVSGCLHNCEYCYAKAIARRFGAGLKPMDLPELDKPVMGSKGKAEAYPFDFSPTLYKYRLGQPKKWREGKKIFVCSVADLFGKWVPDRWIESVFNACKEAPWHTYLFLTKNPMRYIELEKSGLLPHQDNMWLGSSVTKKNDMYAWMDKAVKTHYFLSVEPILEPLGMIGSEEGKPEWVIVGAESGHRRGRVIPERWWIEELVNNCRKYGIAVFMKSSLSKIWGNPLIQEYPKGIKIHGKEDGNNGE